MINNYKFKLNIPNVLFILVTIGICLFGATYHVIPSIPVIVFLTAYVLIRSLYLGQVRFDFKLLFLMEAFFIRAMLDQHTGKAWRVPTTFMLPMLMYLFGKLYVTVKEEDEVSELRAAIGMIALAVGTAVLGILNFKLTKVSPMYPMGYYSLAFTGNTMFTDKYTFMFNFIMAGVMVVAFGAWLITKLCQKNTKFMFARNIVFAIGCVGVALAIILWYVRDIRWTALKEGVYLMVTQHWGNFAFTVMGVDVNNSSNMWLEYGRESGIMVLIPLLIFWALTIADVIWLGFNKQVNTFVKWGLILAYSFLNVYCFIESYPFLYPNLWYISLIISGMISVLKVYGQKKEEPVKEPTLSEYAHMVQ